LAFPLYGIATDRGVVLVALAVSSHEPPGDRKEVLVPEPSAVDGVLRSLIEAMEAREAAEPDLPEWEANARLRAAEQDLLRLYRESGRLRSQRVAIDIDIEAATLESTTVEVA
jgi:hypothetical protein